VIEAPQVTRVPMAPAPVAGVAAVRGDILPIVDLGVRLRGVPTARAHRLVTVELERGAGRVGLLADDVVGMIQVSSPEAIEAVPEAVADHLPADVAAGVYAPSEDRLIVILDLDELLAIEAVAKER
jgi:purine-binding chemotaxis protein CheW